MDTMMDVTDYLCIDFIIFNDFFFLYPTVLLIFALRLFMTGFILLFIIHLIFFCDIIIDQVISSL